MIENYLWLLKKIREQVSKKFIIHSIGTAFNPAEKTFRIDLGLTKDEFQCKMEFTLVEVDLFNIDKSAKEWSDYLITQFESYRIAYLKTK